MKCLLLENGLQPKKYKTMKINLIATVIGIYLLGISAFGQDLEVSGVAKVKQMALDNSANNLVVRQSDGTLGDIVVDQKEFLKNKASIVGTDIQVLETDNAVYIYGINDTGKKTIYSQYKFFLNNKNSWMDVRTRTPLTTLSTN